MRALRSFAGFAVFAAGVVVSVAADLPPATAILEDLKAFREYGSVLHVAAHPDDENTNFITAMAKGRHFRSAYLSVTRGDGGQNEIGQELDALLGLSRTHELLAARRIDGGRQYFTRALDFGYSKTVDETLQFWGRDEVIGDIVRVIRTFKPDVIVNNFVAAPQAGNHGNHNASAILALEAFKLAGDPKAYPEQLADGLTVWQPKRIMQGPGSTDVTGVDPVTLETFATLSQRSRAMHHTQGFGVNPGGGAAGGRGGAPGGRGGAAAPAAPTFTSTQAAAVSGTPTLATAVTAAVTELQAAYYSTSSSPADRSAKADRLAQAELALALARAGALQSLQASPDRLSAQQLAYLAAGNRVGPGTFNHLAGDPAVYDLMDGIDTTWGRVPNGGAEIGKLTDDAIAQFKPADPSASVPALLAIRTKLAALPKETILDEKRALLDQIIANSLGLSVETSIAQAEIVPGEAIRMKHTVSAKATNLPIRWTGIRYPNAAGQPAPFAAPVAVGAAATSRDDSAVLPATTRVSQPYWLREQSKPGLFVVPGVDRKLIGQPENPPVFPVELLFNIGGQTLALPTEPLQPTTNKLGVSRPRKIDAISPVTVHFASIVKVLAPGATGPVEIELTGNRANESGVLAIDLPAGWTATPASQNFRLGAAGSKSTFTFQVKAPAATNSGNLGAHVTINNQRFDTDRYIIDYDHIPLQLLQPRAMAKAVSVNLSIRGQKVAYLPGSGDDVAECLKQMGYTVSIISGADLTAAKLAGFDTVVIGVRAFNERTDFAPNVQALFKWVEDGGTVVAQYNRPNGLTTPTLAPYPLSIQGNAPSLRVTDEKSPVTFLAPDNRAVIVPNRLGPEDFDGWVQERGAYFPSSWDTDHFKPLFAMNDPSEGALNSSILVAQHGKGYYVYSGIGFFRQLPKGVPGAYRLFANLVSLGK